MAEIFSFPEGSAYLYTAGGSAVGTYVRNADAQCASQRHSYRPPLSTTRTYVPLDKNARLTIQQAQSQVAWKKLAHDATGGSVHCHLKWVNPGTNASAGVWLYTGEIVQMGIADGDESIVNIQATFENWSAY
jgi:hypothetical protein